MTAPPRARTRSRTPAVDALVAGAVDLARAAAEEEAGGADRVGEHLGVHADGERVVTHSFACLDLAYRGWRWAATLARASRSRVVTVDEVVLLPGPDALLPPEWVPWSERLRPGDLGVGDLLPTPADDERLDPGYVPLDPADEDAALAWELGLGRPRVLSRLGRDLAAERWYDGDRGPEAPIALVAPARCATCGFFLLLAGSLRQVFGVCANEYAPDDGRVVSADHGCGAHSEAASVAAAGVPLDVVVPIVDEVGYDVLALGGAGEALHSPGSVDAQEPPEDLGHS